MYLVFGAQGIDSFNTALFSLFMAQSVRILQECFFVSIKMREVSISERNLIRITAMAKIKDRDQNLKSFDKM